MALRISYLIIFGIIPIIDGKPYEEETFFVKNQYELKKLLQMLWDQGKYDISLSHHEDGPDSHHEDRASISRHDDKPRKYYSRNAKSNSARYSTSYENLNNYGPTRQISLQALNDAFKNKYGSRYDGKQNNILENILGAGKFFRQEKANDEAESDNANEVLEFLSDLQRNLADDDNYVSELRCVGKRCARNRNDRNDRNKLRCKGRNCAKHRDEKKTNYVDDRIERDTLRCVGNKCSRYDRDNDRDGRDNRDSLRCRGNKCARSRYNDNDADLKDDADLLANKIKINNDLDAVVLDVSEVDRLLSKFNDPKQKRTSQLRDAKLLENVDVQSLLDTKSSKDKKSNVEAVVFDLTQVENGEVLANQIKRVLKNKNDEASYDDYEEYGNLVEEHLKHGVINLEKQINAEEESSKIVAHNEDNNNVYVPQWLLDEVMKTNLRQISDTQLLKSLFPLTRQQKEKMRKKIEQKGDNGQGRPRKLYRRNYEQEVGVPFHLEVQGLGQVSP